MKEIVHMRACIAIGVACVLALSTCGSAAAGKDEQAVAVAELERQLAIRTKAAAEAEDAFKNNGVSRGSLDKARRDLAEARFRLADAHGKKQEALEELKKIAVYHVRAVERVVSSTRFGVACQADIDNERRCLAEARLRIAEATNDGAGIQKHLRKIIGCQLKNVERMRGLYRVGLVSRTAVRKAEDCLAQSRARLQSAEQNARQAE